jgi:hypothetical protein
MVFMTMNQAHKVIRVRLLKYKTLLSYIEIQWVLISIIQLQEHYCCKKMITSKSGILFHKLQALFSKRNKESLHHHSNFNLPTVLTLTSLTMIQLEHFIKLFVKKTLITLKARASH